VNVYNEAAGQRTVGKDVFTGLLSKVELAQVQLQAAQVSVLV
jgi:hypothetical protein